MNCAPRSAPLLVLKYLSELGPADTHRCGGGGIGQQVGRYSAELRARGCGWVGRESMVNVQNRERERTAPTTTCCCWRQPRAAARESLSTLRRANTHRRGHHHRGQLVGGSRAKLRMCARGENENVSRPAHPSNQSASEPHTRQPRASRVHIQPYRLGELGGHRSRDELRGGGRQDIERCHREPPPHVTGWRRCCLIRAFGRPCAASVTASCLQRLTEDPAAPAA